MSSDDLTMQSPLPARFKAWMDERFPLKNSILSILVYFSTALVARYAVDDSDGVAIKFTDAIGCVVTWSLFFLLRVFDEHKDYALDVRNHPQRVLQRGLITLNHLKVVGLGCIFLQVIWSVLMDGGLGNATVAWSVMFVWVCLMGAEFFCGEWLEKRLTLYAFSHMLVMFLIGWWAANMAVENVVPGFLLGTQLLMLFVGGFSFEIARKTRGPEEERESVDSYSRVFGVQGAAHVVLGLVTALALIQAVIVISAAGAFWLGLGVIAVVYALNVRQLFQFMAAPSLAMREKNEAMVGLLMVAGFFVVIVAVLVARGASFSFV